MQRSRLEHFARLGGVELNETTDIEVDGDDPVLASPYHLGEGAATVLGLIGQEASDIGERRGIAPQSLRVSVARAAASLLSFLFLTIDGGFGDLEGPGGRRRLTRIFACRDGRFVHLHGSFDDPSAILGVLGIDESADDDRIEHVLRARDAFEVEDDLANAGMCGAVCRTTIEWRAHPQGEAIADGPLIELIKIGDAPKLELRGARRPLEGFRVLDLTRVLAGPTVARTLAEHGAEVLHISGPHLPTVPHFEVDTGHGKRQASLDLRAASDRDVLVALIEGCDVFSQSFQPGSLARLGLGPDQLAHQRPGIIYVSEDAYGHAGPWRTRPGWEQLAQAATGMCMEQSSPVPTLAPAAANDYTTGYLGALGVLLALQRRIIEGGSWLVQVSLARTAMWIQDLGADLDRSEASGLPDFSGQYESMPSPYGELRFLGPALQMSATPPRYELAARPLGVDAPIWAGA